jgi:hypothetical protein
VISLGWLIHAGPGSARILGSVVLLKRSGCFARAAARVAERFLAMPAAWP